MVLRVVEQGQAGEDLIAARGPHLLSGSLAPSKAPPNGWMSLLQGGPDMQASMLSDPMPMRQLPHSEG